MTYQERIIERSKALAHDALQDVAVLEAEYKEFNTDIRTKISELTSKFLGLNPEDKFNVDISDINYGDIRISHELLGHGMLRDILVIRIPAMYSRQLEEDDEIDLSKIRMELRFADSNFNLADGPGTDMSVMNMYANLINKLNLITAESSEAFATDLRDLRLSATKFNLEYYAASDVIRDKVKSAILNTVMSEPIEFGTNLKELIGVKTVKPSRNLYVNLEPIFVEMKSKTVKVMYTVNETDKDMSHLNKSKTFKRPEFEKTIAEYFYRLMA